MAACVSSGRLYDLRYRDREKREKEMTIKQMTMQESNQIRDGKK